jgi:glycosyltransferase involved in cell wall biosynthesis
MKKNTSTLQTASVATQSSTLKIAWLGEISDRGGGQAFGAILLEGLLRQGIAVDYYCSFEDPPEWLYQYEDVTIIAISPNWSWNRWYSCTPFRAFLSSTVARTRAYNRLCDRLLKRHENQPYDCIFQFSQPELFKLGRHRHRLPAIVIYPGVHTAGELYWHRQESAYALQSEPMWRHYLVRAFLTYRTWLQKREMQKPTLVLGMSQRFNNLVAADYQLSPNQLAVLHHPIPAQDPGTAKLTDAIAQQRTQIKLLFVARMSVRKGLQYIVELSHRLDDLAEQIQIEIIGGYTQWSDYRAHLKNLNSRTASYLGRIEKNDLLKIYDNADVLLLPSLYEPGGLVVGEALSRGLSVVVSDAVGSAEVLSGDCFREFPTGDMDAFEQQVRHLIDDLRAQRQALRHCARLQCQEKFDPTAISQQLVNHLKDAIALNPVVGFSPHHELP